MGRIALPVTTGFKSPHSSGLSSFQEWKRFDLDVNKKAASRRLKQPRLMTLSGKETGSVLIDVQFYSETAATRYDDFILENGHQVEHAAEGIILEVQIACNACVTREVYSNL